MLHPTQQAVPEQPQSHLTEQSGSFSHAGLPQHNKKVLHMNIFVQKIPARTAKSIPDKQCESPNSTLAWFWGGSGGRPDVGSPALTPNKVRLCLVCIEGKMREKKPLQDEIPYMTAC